MLSWIFVSFISVANLQIKMTNKWMMVDIYIYLRSKTKLEQEDV